MTVDELEDEAGAETCENCRGTGRGVDLEWLHTILQLLMLAGAEGVDRRAQLHPWLRALTLAPHRPPPGNPMAIDPPTRQLARLTGGLAGRPPRECGGHDAIDLYEACNKVIAAAGLPPDWGLCGRCGGEGYTVPKTMSARGSR